MYLDAVSRETSDRVGIILKSPQSLCFFNLSSWNSGHEQPDRMRAMLSKFQIPLNFRAKMLQVFRDSQQTMCKGTMRFGIPY